jgi:predicted NUDIX family phosphoesterase
MFSQNQANVANFFKKYKTKVAYFSCLNHEFYKLYFWSDFKSRFQENRKNVNLNPTLKKCISMKLIHNFHILLIYIFLEMS